MRPSGRTPNWLTLVFKIATACALSACAQAISATPISGAFPTPRLLPTSAASPTTEPSATKESATESTAQPAAQTATVRPTRTQGAPLNLTGPWLVGVGDAGVVALNPDGTGRNALRGPPLWQPEQDIAEGDGLSSGGWIAARIGIPNNWRSPLTVSSPTLVGPAEVGIAVWQLPGLEPVRVIPRFSDSLVAGMSEVRHFDLPYEEEATGPGWQYDMAFISLLHEDARLFWSPNGQYLAFAAALDGPSADVYVYDPQQDAIRRLTDGPNQAVLLGWSPDSRWILHYETSAYLASHGEVIGFAADVMWAVTVDGSRINRLGAGGWTLPTVSGWLSPTTVVLTVGTGGSSLPTRLWSIDLEGGARRERRDLSVYSVAVDPATDVIAVSADALVDPDGGYRDGGLFVLRMGDAQPRRAGSNEQSSCYGCRVEWNKELGLFSLYSPSWAEWPEPPITFLPSGETVNAYEDEVSRPVVSPDGRWVAFGGDGVHVYDSQGGRLDLPGRQIRDLVWNAESTGLFYVEERGAGGELMFVQFAGGIASSLNPDIAITGLHLVPAFPSH